MVVLLSCFRLTLSLPICSCSMEMFNFGINERIGLATSTTYSGRPAASAELFPPYKHEVSVAQVYSSTAYVAGHAPYEMQVNMFSRISSRWDETGWDCECEAARTALVPSPLIDPALPIMSMSVVIHEA